MSDHEEQKPKLEFGSEEPFESQEKNESLIKIKKSIENETENDHEEESANETEGERKSEIDNDGQERGEGKDGECVTSDQQLATVEGEEILKTKADKEEEIEAGPKMSVPQPSYNYTFTRRRSEFGRQCIFGDASFTLCELDPDEALKRRFQRAKTVQLPIQNIPQMAQDEVATDNAIMDNFGVYHQEGGWPNEIDISNEKEKLKYREMSEQAEYYSAQLEPLCVKMEHKISQNNAVNLFEEYFTVEHPQYGRSYNPIIESIAFFQCPVKNEQHKIIASHSALASGSHDKIVVSYTAIARGQMNTTKTRTSSFIWDLEKNIKPILELQCEASLATVEYSEKDESIIAAGQSDGIIALLDSVLKVGICLFYVFFFLHF